LSFRIELKVNDALLKMMVALEYVIKQKEKSQQSRW